MARRLSRFALGAASILLGGVCLPGVTRAAGIDDEGGLDLSAVYAARLSLAAAPVRPAPRTVIAALAGVPGVSESELSGMRAGFALPSGLSLNFGFSSSTFLNGSSEPIQTLNVDFSGSASNYSGSVAVTSNGATQTTDLSSTAGATSVLTRANNGLTSVQTTITNSGLTTTISNAANNQVIQQVQTLDLTTTGLKSIMSQQVAQTALLKALSAGNVLRGR